MYVEVLAHTNLTLAGLDIMQSWDNDSEPGHGRLPTHSDRLAEVAGRNCYQSWDHPNPKTASNRGYLDNILKHQHFSVLEHASVTFYVAGVSRSLTHELVRHRHLSFSQLSQRYVDESYSDFVNPPLFDELWDRKAEAGNEVDTAHNAMLRILDVVEEAQNAYARFVDAATKLGISRKKAREAARSIYPNGTATVIVVTGNVRAWREFVQKRNSRAADAEIQELARLILLHLKEIAPNSVRDLIT